METNVIYIGLDVDDTQYHGTALNKKIGEVITFQCRPTLAGLLKQLAKQANAFPDSSLSLCYEASYIRALPSKLAVYKATQLAALPMLW